MPIGKYEEQGLPVPRLKIYLAGPMRGIANFNFPAFDCAAEKLRTQGFEVFSPADHDRELHGEAIENNPTGDERECFEKFGFTIRKALGADLRWICAHADIVALLPGWEHSTGATAERAVGIALGLTIMVLGKEYDNV